MSWVYLGGLVAFIAIMFVVLKRPMYEAVIFAFILLCIFSGNIANIGSYIMSASNTYLLFTIAAFSVFSLIFEKTKVIDGLVNIIIAVVGRFSGGAGYVALIASAIMGTLCGSAPGTAAAIGVTTIPTMKKTGFSPELAAAVESSASCLGPIIPPAAAITAMFVFVEDLYPGQFSFSQLWLLAWVVSFWFILQRFLTLFFVVKKNNVKPIPKEERISLKDALKNDWKSLIVPVVIFGPFLIDALFKDSFITARLGEYASDFTAILLTVIPSVASLIAILIYRSTGKRFVLKDYFNLIGESISSVAPIIVTAFGGFALSELFSDLGVAKGIGASLAAADMPLWFVAIVVPLVFSLLGMFIEPFSLEIMFGGVFLALTTSVGINPLLASMMFVAMTCGLSPMTPPFALSQFVCMGIAESDFKKTSLQLIPWVLCHYLLIVMCMFGLIPMLVI